MAPPMPAGVSMKIVEAEVQADPGSTTDRIDLVEDQRDMTEGTKVPTSEDYSEMVFLPPADDTDEAQPSGALRLPPSASATDSDPRSIRAQSVTFADAAETSARPEPSGSNSGETSHLVFLGTPPDDSEGESPHRPCPIDTGKHGRRISRDTPSSPYTPASVGASYDSDYSEEEEEENEEAGEAPIGSAAEAPYRSEGAQLYTISGLDKAVQCDLALQNALDQDLLDAAQQGDVERLHDLLYQLGADTRITDDFFCNTAFHLCSKFGHADSLHHLVQFHEVQQHLDSTVGKLDLEMVNAFGHTPLIEAALHGRAECVRVLLDFGASTAAPDNKGRVALHHASMHGHERCVLLLLSYRARIDFEDQWRNNQPLHLAAMNGHAKVAELLTSVGARVDAVNARGQTPLELATQQGHREVLDVFKKVKTPADTRRRAHTIEVDLIENGATDLKVGPLDGDSSNDDGVQIEEEWDDVNPFEDPPNDRA